jgi:hypothetical protein
MGIWVFASVTDKWGEGKKQEDGTTVYKRIFEVPASHWEPNNITNYFVDFERSNLHIAEGYDGKYFHVDVTVPNSQCHRMMSITKNSKNDMFETTLTLGKSNLLGEYCYRDLNDDGRLDLFFDNANNKSFIITNDQMIPVVCKRTKDQDTQKACSGDTYQFRDGQWGKL